MVVEMKFETKSIDFANYLDSIDPLRNFRQEFHIQDHKLIYLDGNSLGRLPVKTISEIDQTVRDHWGDQLIRSWNESWINKPIDTGAKISRLIGANPSEVIVADSTSINLFKLVVAALKSNPDRKKIVSDVLNFPSDIYIIEGIIELLGQGHYLELIPSEDSIHIDMDHVRHIIDENTALVCLTHVAFKSAYMYDIEAVTKIAHDVGALILWDLSHSTGAVPINLSHHNVDLAVGCTYKYLNAGPGSPAFLYVREDLQKELISPIWVWFADSDPFSFDLNFKPNRSIKRFAAGTPPILSIIGISSAVDILLNARIDRLRNKSILQTEYLIYLAEQLLLQEGFKIGSPRNPEIRGSHISIQHSEAFRINRAMIESPPPAIQIIPDFRSPDNIRLGIAPIYTTFAEINLAIHRIQEIFIHKVYKSYSPEKSFVT